MITIILTNYRRPNNMLTILDSLMMQSIIPEIFLWDNSPEQTFQDKRVKWIIRSSLNAKCSARWWLAQHADTPLVAVMDDDLAPADQHVLRDTVNHLHSHAAVGATGVVLNPRRCYRDCNHIIRSSKDTYVDIVKGRFFAVHRDRLLQIPAMPLDCEDDIVVSARIGGGIIPAGFLSRFRELPTGDHGRERRPTHWKCREAARREMFSK